MCVLRQMEIIVFRSPGSNRSAKIVTSFIALISCSWEPG